MADRTGRKCSKEIPITIGNVTRYVKNVTTVTTCCDVIKMILKKLNIGKENLPYYTIFESAKGVDRPLAGRTLILKTMRSWGSDNNYKFVLRKCAPAVTYITQFSEAKRQKLPKWSTSSNSSLSEKSYDAEGNDKMKSNENTRLQRRKCLKGKFRISDRKLAYQLFDDDSSDSDSMDEFMSQVDTGKLTDFWDFCNAVTRSEIRRLEKRAEKKRETSSSGTWSKTGRSSEIKVAVRKKLKKFESVDNLQVEDCKQELMQKYLADVSMFQTPEHRRMKTNYGIYGKDNLKSISAFSNNKTPCFTGDNAKYWSVYGESEYEETDLDSSLEKAFLAGCNVSDDLHLNDSGIKVKYADNFKRPSFDYNDSVQKLVDYSLSDDECENKLTQEGNVDIRQFLCSDGIYDEDDAMESFMKTKIFDDFSDEGLSSMDSDEEKEILV